MFFADTVDVDMTPLHRRFLPLLPEAVQVRNAGCGSGREALAFAKRGRRVTAFDASPGLVALAVLHGGRPVQCLCFQEIAWRDAFDGIWACASLLHVPAAELPDAMQRRAGRSSRAACSTPRSSAAAASASTTAGASPIRTSRAGRRC